MISFPRIRVAAYVIRHGVTGSRLLVVDHVAGLSTRTQVPAGGVAAGESTYAAVVRRLAQETGVTGARVVTELGTEDRPHPESGLPRRTTYFHLEAPPGGPDEWAHQVTGKGPDNGLRFACRFVPLPLGARLPDHQDVFLGCIDPRWGTADEERAGLPTPAWRQLWGSRYPPPE